MRVHVVPDETIRAVGFAPNRSLRFPPGSYDPVDHPRDAEIILPGVDLFACKDREMFLRVPCVAQYERRCALMDCADNYTLYNTPAILIRGNLNNARLADAPNSLNLGWPVEDMAQSVRDIHRAVPLVPPDGYTHEIGFHGWTKSKDTRQRAYDSCVREFGDRFDGAAYPDFSGYLWNTDGTPKAEWLCRRHLFIDCLTRSRVQLCPESIDGVLPYRFFEAISAGRIAALVGSNYVLPWRDEINYAAFCLFIPEREAEQAGPVIRKWLNGETDTTLEARGALGRAAFTRWLDSRYSPERQREAVEKQARKAGLL